MTFHSNTISIGTRVRLVKDLELLSGTFECGTEMTVTGFDNIGGRGWELIDDEGNHAIEVPSSYCRIIL